MSIVRKYKLWKLGIPQKSELISTFEFTEQMLSDLVTVYEFEYDKDIVTYKKKEINEDEYLNWVFEYDTAMKTINPRYREFVERIMILCHSNKSDTVSLIKEIVTKKYGLEIK